VAYMSKHCTNQRF